MRARALARSRAASSLQFPAREVASLVREGGYSGNRDQYIHSARAGSLAHDYASTLMVSLVFNRSAKNVAMLHFRILLCRVRYKGQEEIWRLGRRALPAYNLRITNCEGIASSTFPTPSPKVIWAKRKSSGSTTKMIAIVTPPPKKA